MVECEMIPGFLLILVNAINEIILENQWLLSNWPEEAAGRQEAQISGKT